MCHFPPIRNNVEKSILPYDTDNLGIADSLYSDDFNVETHFCLESVMLTGQNTQGQCQDQLTKAKAGHSPKAKAMPRPSHNAKD